jgi:two-component system LytT family response regulator
VTLRSATLRTVIADDEPLARERLKLLLAPDRDVEVVAECRNGSEAVTALKASPVDLLFLDIQMPGKDGFDVIEEIGLPNMPMTVFVTAHNEYAVDAFALHVLDYQDGSDKYSVVENVKTLPKAKTMALDPKTHQLFLSTAEAGQFEVLVVGK